MRRVISRVLSVALALWSITACEAMTHSGDFSTTGLLCPDGYLSCVNACFDGQFDRNHCGSCDVACPSAAVCSEGTCGGQCTGGTTLCGSGCVDTQHDPK
ncbi:MAG TPA: hypothetical protein VNO21_05030, partial [Polyangiaceae bacterium]|nr:hypothetical protein [Polyangiaceae bacterium]